MSMGSNGNASGARREGYTVIKDWLIDDDERVGKNEFLAYVVLCRFANKEGTCWPGLDKIAKRARMGRSSLIVALANLEKIGIIRKDRRPNNSTVYTIMDSPEVQKSDPGSPEFGPLDVQDLDSKDSQKKDSQKKDREFAEEALRFFSRVAKMSRELKDTPSRIKTIAARVKEGATMDIVKDVIVAKRGDEWFVKNGHFTPETIFRASNFWKYYDACKISSPEKNEDTVRCPACGMPQRAGRTNCIDCGAIL